VNVGKSFPKWLKKEYPLKADHYKFYSHKLPDGLCVETRQCRNDMLEIFIEFIDDEWLPNHAPDYLESRARKAPSFLPKLVPPQKQE